MQKRVKKRFDFTVPSLGATVSETFELDKNITAVKGLVLTSNLEELLYHRGSQRIEINGEEIFPDNYNSKLLMCGINVSPHLRFYDLGSVNAGNGKVKVTYKDTPDGRTSFDTYIVHVILDCEITDEG